MSSVPPSSRSRTHLPLALVLASFVAACGGGGGSPAPSVVIIQPENGASDVPPDAVVTLVLGSRASALVADDVVVSDGGNRLPGQLQRIAETETWRWTPAQELPRGCRVTVSTRQQGVVTTFTVRDLATKATFELPSELVAEAFAWPNGRRAMRTESGRVFELEGSGLVERFVDLPPDARTFGDGAFVGEVLDAGIRYCVRGDLDGAYDRVPTPFGVSIGGINQNGDVAVFVPLSPSAVTEPGLWRLVRGAAQWDLAGYLSLDSVTDEPSIDAQGAVYLAYSISGLVRLSRFPVGDLVGRSFDLPISGVVPRFDCAADGSGLLAFTVVQPAGGLTQVSVLAARFDPQAGLTMLDHELRSWSVGLPPAGVQQFHRVEAVHVGAYGSACVLLASGNTIWNSTTTNYEAARVERDGRVGQSFELAISTSGALALGAARRSPLRAEAWGMNAWITPGTIHLTRSRPDDVVFGEVYTAPPGGEFGAWCFAFDDSGRALLALVEQPGGVGPPTGSRIVVLE